MLANLKIMIPQLIIIMLGMIGLGMNVAKHGEPKDSKYNGWTHLVATLIIWTVLYYGGFWNGLL